MPDDGTNVIPVLRARLKVSLAAVGLAGFGLVYFSTIRYGAGLSEDSVGYAAVARNVAAGRGLLSYQGTPFVEQGPLYPLILGAITHAFAIDPISSANVVNAVAFGLIVFFSGVLIFRYLAASPFYSWLGVSLVVFSRPLFQVSVMAWSEPLFIVLVLAFLLLLGSFLDRQTLRVLVFLSIAATLACLERYAGVTLIISGAASLFLCLKSSKATRLTTCLIFVAISSLPVGAYLLRNYKVAGTFVGPRGASNHSLPANFAFTLRGVLEWFFPRAIVAQRATFTILSVFLGVSLVGALIWVGVRSRQRHSREDTPAVAHLCVVFLFFATYLTFLVISSTVVAYDTIGGRLLSPVFVPFLVFSLSAIYMLSEGMKNVKQVAAGQWVLAGFVALLLSYRLVSVGFAVRECVTEGAGGYSSRSWRTSNLSGYLHKTRLKPEHPFYTNSPEALYLFSGVSATLSPERKGRHLAGRLAGTNLAVVSAAWPPEPTAYLVWFYNVHRRGLLSIGELQEVANVSPLVKFSDGEICVVSRREER
jgi:hypothetical protein